MLGHRRSEADALLQELQGQLVPINAPSVDPRVHYMMLATLRNGMRQVEAELGWLDEIEKDLP